MVVLRPTRCGSTVPNKLRRALSLSFSSCQPPPLVSRHRVSYPVNHPWWAQPQLVTYLLRRHHVLLLLFLLLRLVHTKKTSIDLWTPAHVSLITCQAPLGLPVPGPTIPNLELLSIITLTPSPFLFPACLPSRLSHSVPSHAPRPLGAHHTPSPLLRGLVCALGTQRGHAQLGGSLPPHLGDNLPTPVKIPGIKHKNTAGCRLYACTTALKRACVHQAIQTSNLIGHVSM